MLHVAAKFDTQEFKTALKALVTAAAQQMLFQGVSFLGLFGNAEAEELEIKEAA